MDARFRALRLACERPGQPKLVQTALSVIEKLVSSEILVGSGPVSGESRPQTPESNPPSEPESAEGTRVLNKPAKIMMDEIVDTIFQAVKGADDEETQLLAIRCVLSCVLSRQGLVHGSALMTCIRTCYLINKDSKSATAQSTATAALTQLLNTLTVRLEDSSLTKRFETSAPFISDWVASYAHNILNKTVLLTDPDNEENDARGRFGWCIICDKPAEYHCRRARDPVCSIECKRINLERRDAVGQRDPSSPRAPSPTAEYLDVLTVFKSLCKLSSSGNPPPPAGVAPSTVSVLPDQRMIKAKRLSLELISSMLESAGSVYLRTDPGFIDLVKRSLFVSLLTNAVSPVPRIFAIALQIFTQLVSDFQPFIIREIGLFTSQVFLYILESENSSFGHKLRILEIFSIIFSDAKIAVEIFQLFDCCIDETNVIELSLNALSAIVQGRFSGPISHPTTAAAPPSQLTPDQQTQLKKAAMKSIVGLVSSMAGWLKEDAVPSVVTTSEDKESVEAPVSEGAESASTATTAASEGKQRKLLLEQGLDLFKSKPGKGIEFLVEHQFIPAGDPVSVAKALMELPSLDKTAVGEFVGENKPFNLECFYAFVELMDFKQLELDQALRRFLAHFRLPGEAQKIDRIMEKFAEKFVNENPGRYANADSAYVLSFAVIMLNTDLHSPQIKKKMTVGEFVKLGRGINTEIEISEAELERLYNNILTEAISLREDDEARSRAGAAVVPVGEDAISVQRRRFEMFLKETEQMIQKSTMLVEKRSKTAAKMSSVKTSLSDVRDLMLSAAAPILAALSHSVDSGELDPALITAMVECVKICVHFELEVAKNDYFQALARLAMASTGDQKRSDAVSAILHLAVEHGNGLGVTCWATVVRLLSLIDKMTLIVDNKSRPGEIASATATPQATGLSRLVSAVWTPAAVEAARLVSALEKSNAETIINSVDLGLIDLVFSRSTALNPVNLLALISALIQTSLESELQEPRLFCCQKIVEIADFNMGRIRIVWGKIWSAISPYLVQLAQSKDQQVCVFAIDSLRQLALKFLSKPELGNYHFQSEFLKPFLTIMKSQTHSVQIQELILSVIDSLIQQVAGNLKSGWQAVLTIVGIASQSSDASIAASARRMLETVDSGASLAGVKDEHFRDVFACVVSLIQNSNSSSETLEFAWKSILSNIDRIASIHDTSTTSQWLTLFKGLTLLLLQRQPVTREKASHLLFSEILETRISAIDADTIQIFLRAVLIPFCDDLIHSIGEGTVSMDLGIQVAAAVSSGLNRTVDIHFETKFSNFIFELLNLNLLFVCFDKSDKIAELGVDNLRRVLGQATHFDQTKWDQTVDGLVKMMNGTLPVQLLENTNVTSISVLPFNPESIVNLCVSHLNVVQLVSDLIDAVASQPNFSLRKLLEIVTRSREFAIRFNAEFALREKLKALGFMRDLRQLPGLLKQERAATSVILKVLFSMTSDAAAAAQLATVCGEIVDNYAVKETKLASVSVQIRDTLIDEIEREITGIVPLIANVIVGGFVKMPDTEIFANRKWIFSILTRLVKVSNPVIRQSVARALETKISVLVLRD